MVDLASQVEEVLEELEVWVASEEETSHHHLVVVLQEGSAARRSEEVATRLVLVDLEASVVEVEEE